MRDLLKANEVIDEIKQHEVLDLTSCGLIGVPNASLGGVDRFGYPQTRTARRAEAKCHVLECDPHDHMSVSLDYGCRVSSSGLASGFRWTADENMINERSEERSQRVKAALRSSSPEWRMKCATRLSVLTKTNTKDDT